MGLFFKTAKNVEIYTVQQLLTQKENIKEICNVHQILIILFSVWFLISRISRNGI